MIVRSVDKRDIIVSHPLWSDGRIVHLAPCDDPEKQPQRSNTANHIVRKAPRTRRSAKGVARH
jgi:hypothetical protein